MIVITFVLTDCSNDSNKIIIIIIIIIISSSSSSTNFSCAKCNFTEVQK